MKTFTDLEKETNQIALLDTNVVINLEHRKCSSIDLSAINKVLSSDICPFLTDFSFIELIAGSNDLITFKKHCNELNDMEFILCGCYEPLCKFISGQNYDLLTDNFKFEKFKKKIIKYKNKIIFPLFEKLFHLYAKICLILFHENDRYYWDKAFFMFNELMLKNEFRKFIFECYIQFIDDKNESKNLIKNLFLELLINILISIDSRKYKENDLRDRIPRLINPKEFSLLIRNLGVNNYTPYNDWLISGFIEKTRKIIDKNDNYPILSDGICFIAATIILNNANLDSHDFIDILNIYFASRQKLEVHYFSNDKRKWGRFIEIENRIRPNIKLFFNN